MQVTCIYFHTNKSINTNNQVQPTPGRPRSGNLRQWPGAADQHVGHWDYVFQSVSNTSNSQWCFRPGPAGNYCYGARAAQTQKDRTEGRKDWIPRGHSQVGDELESVGADHIRNYRIPKKWIVSGVFAVIRGVDCFWSYGNAIHDYHSIGDWST